jgi:hypothetical protein
MPQKNNSIRRQKAWVRLVSDLCADIKQWSEARNWSVHQDKKTVTERNIGTYEVPFLTIQTPQGRVHIDPVGADIMNADGRVDILSFPGLNRLVLVRRKDKWNLYTDAGVRWPKAWGPRSFPNLVQLLTE